MNYHFNELLQYTTLSNFKFKYNRVTVQFSCLINKKKKIWPSTAWHFFTDVHFHQFYYQFAWVLFFFLYLLVCYWYHNFFSFITLVWGKYKQLNSVKHRMPYVLIESACCRIRSKKNCKFYIKTEKKIIICKVEKSNVVVSWLLCYTDFVNMNSAERLDLLQLQN